MTENKEEKTKTQKTTDRKDYNQNQVQGLVIDREQRMAQTG